MSEPIKAGDLVMVVRQPHCNGRNLGEFYPVISISSIPENNTTRMCLRCGYWSTEADFAQLTDTKYAPLSWLKRIDPPAQPETTHQPEEIAA